MYLRQIRRETADERGGEERLERVTHRGEERVGGRVVPRARIVTVTRALEIAPVRRIRSRVMEHAREYFDTLNREYIAVHKTKEDLFWSTYMATSDDHAGFARAENAYKDFIADPARLTDTRAAARAVHALRRPGRSVTRCCTASRDGWRSSKPTSSTAPRAAR